MMYEIIKKRATKDDESGGHMVSRETTPFEEKIG